MQHKIVFPNKGFPKWDPPFMINSQKIKFSLKALIWIYHRRAQQNKMCFSIRFVVQVEAHIGFPPACAVLPSK